MRRIFHTFAPGLDGHPACRVCSRVDDVHPKIDGKIVRLRAERCDVKIDRSTPWGNPFVIGKDGDRHEVVEKFRLWAETSADPKALWIREHVHELRGKTLGCWCSPLDCHGFVLLEMAVAAHG